MTITSETRSAAGRVTALYRRAGKAGQNRLGVALLVIAVSQLIVLMGTTIVTMSLPRIGSALGFSTTGLLWVVNLSGGHQQCRPEPQHLDQRTFGELLAADTHREAQAPHVKLAD
jgi:hypothetical protein